ncbi:MAG: mannose-6-phosphate isomerase, partial [Actinomycetota bacterium]
MAVRFTGSVQNYAWGGTAFIPGLLGLPAGGSPCAEWWLGTHPVAPSVISGTGEPLSSVTGEMTMLVKVLSC